MLKRYFSDREYVLSAFLFLATGRFCWVAEDCMLVAKAYLLITYGSLEIRVS